MQHTKKPKLLILCDDITVTGGVERVVSNLANALTTSNETTTTNATANGLATNITGGGENYPHRKHLSHKQNPALQS